MHYLPRCYHSVLSSELVFSNSQPAAQTSETDIQRRVSYRESRQVRGLAAALKEEENWLRRKVEGVSLLDEQGTQLSSGSLGLIHCPQLGLIHCPQPNSSDDAGESQWGLNDPHELSRLLHAFRAKNVSVCVFSFKKFFDIQYCISFKYTASDSFPL